jgi:tetratricopeptide (TPR) repeat protein
MAQNKQPGEWQKSSIFQQAGDRAVQIGEVIGTVIVPILITPRAILIAVASVAIAAVTIYCLNAVAQKPARMTGDFNIAVAQFGEVTDQGIVSSARATQLSRMLFDCLDSEYKATDFGLDVQVSHKKIGILVEDREAEKLAYNIDADIVIYGSVFVAGNQASLSPRFYVADQPDTGELTGQHRLAWPIQFDVFTLRFPDKVYTELCSRAAILIHFTEGLAFLSADDFDEAFYYFEEAVGEAESYTPFDGQEVLYLFAAVTSHRQGNSERAMVYLNQALSLNDEYARALIARGNIYYSEALKASFDESKLVQALDEYEKALEARDQPAGAYIREKVNTSLGNVYVILAQQTNDPELFARAIYHYDQVVAQYERTRNGRLKDLAGIAYFGLGAAYERQNDYSWARDSYQRCIKLTTDSELKSRAAQQLDLIKD